MARNSRLFMVYLVLAAMCGCMSPLAGAEANVIDDIEKFNSDGRADVIVNRVVIFRTQGNEQGIGVIHENGTTEVIIPTMVLDCAVVEDGKAVRGMSVKQLPVANAEDDVRQKVAFFSINTSTGIVTWFLDRAMKMQINSIEQGRTYSLKEHWNRLRNQKTKGNEESPSPLPPSPK